METNGTATDPSILKHADCVVEAAGQVFETTCGTSLQPLPGQDLAGEEVVLAIISLVGDLDWAVFVGLPRQTAIKVAHAFAGFDIPFESEDMGDAIGELTNILAGLVKSHLDAKGLEVAISLPTVVRAQGMEMLFQQKADVETFCYDCELGRFWCGLVSAKSSGTAA